LGKLLINLIISVKLTVDWLKAFTIKKLIWSRGRLGRPVANLIVLVIAFSVFTFGELLSSSRFVSSQEISEDYLINITDVIPNRNVATTLVPDERKQTESFAYTVEDGDTLSTIGELFKISSDALEYVNGLTSSSVLAIGDTLIIPPVSGLIHKVASGDTLGSIAEKYDVAPQAIADFNYILDTSTLAVGDELVVPGASVPTPVIPFIPNYPTAPIYAFDVPSLGDGFIWPTTVNIITQYFAWYHNGIDIAVPWGWGMPPVYASSSGTVTRAGWDPWGLGLHVGIDHGNGFETVYGHLSRIDVGYGQRVSKGQGLGLMGNSGRSTGAHLHFTIKYNGVSQNPYNYF
jgi:murein DD-endopeptidase MepM/ murein hydrolase activator NlpD